MAALVSVFVLVSLYPLNTLFAMFRLISLTAGAIIASRMMLAARNDGVEVTISVNNLFTLRAERMVSVFMPSILSIVSDSNRPPASSFTSYHIFLPSSFT